MSGFDRLDGRKFEPCGPGRHGRRFKVFGARQLERGRHRFEVRAVDAAGNVDPTPAKDRFRVV